MRCISFISIVLGFHLSVASYAVTIPAESALSSDYPSTNQSLAYKLLQILDTYDSHQLFQDAALQTTRPWPAAPFNFRSTTEPTWLLRVVSYEPPRLTFRQLHALVSLCYDAQRLVRTLDPDYPIAEINYFFRATTQEPFDLTTQDVEVAVFNSPEEPGEAYKAVDVYSAIDVMLEKMLPLSVPAMSRTVVHYSELQPRLEPRLRFRKVKIQRKTGGSRSNTIATA